MGSSSPLRPSELELLSYPLARMIVSCINDDYPIRRYALAEAKAVHESLGTEPRDFLIAMGQEFGMRPTPSDQGFEMYFAEYLTCSPQQNCEESLGGFIEPSLGSP